MRAGAGTIRQNSRRLPRRATGPGKTVVRDNSLQRAKRLSDAGGGAAPAAECNTASRFLELKRKNTLRREASVLRRSLRRPKKAGEEAEAAEAAEVAGTAEMAAETARTAVVAEGVSNADSVCGAAGMGGADVASDSGGSHDSDASNLPMPTTAGDRQAMAAKYLQAELDRMAASQGAWPPYIINPNSPTKIKWDMAIGACIIYSVCAVPYRIAFDQVCTPLPRCWPRHTSVLL